MDSSLSLLTALGSGISKKPSGMEEGVKRRLVELAMSAKEMAATNEWEKDPWLAQLGLDVEKGWKVEGCGE